MTEKSDMDKSNTIRLLRGESCSSCRMRIKYTESITFWSVREIQDPPRHCALKTTTEGKPCIRSMLKDLLPCKNYWRSDDGRRKLTS